MHADYIYMHYLKSNFNSKIEIFHSDKINKGVPIMRKKVAASHPDMQDESEIH